MNELVLSKWCILLYVNIMLSRSFGVNPHSVVCLNAKEGTISEV